MSPVASLDERRSAAWRRWRHQLHAHPELGYSELATSAFVAEKLDAFGLEVTRGIAGTGVVATLRGRASDRAVGLRAELDALPITEANTFEHRSRVDGCMHACGHDGHIVMLLAAAERLASGPRPDGDVHFIFQPAEEGGGGAARMIADGLLERFPMDAVFAIHNFPGLPLGAFGVRAGPIMAAYDEFAVTLVGEGGHAAMPHRSTDVVLAAAQLIVAAHTIVSRSIDPAESAVVSVTRVSAGEALNALPARAVVEGSCRSFNPDVREVIQSRLRELAGGVSQAFGVRADVELRSTYPTTVNDPAAAVYVQEVVRKRFGADALVTPAPQAASEDFAYILEQAPGCYILLGTGADGYERPVHHPEYDFNDAATPLGVELWIALAQNFFPDIQGIGP